MAMAAAALRSGLGEAAASGWAARAGADGGWVAVEGSDWVARAAADWGGAGLGAAAWAKGGLAEEMGSARAAERGWGWAVTAATARAAAVVERAVVMAGARNLPRILLSGSRVKCSSECSVLRPA